MQIHDLIGIGFGPSNIALAITLEEKKRVAVCARLPAGHERRVCEVRFVSLRREQPLEVPQLVLQLAELAPATTCRFSRRTETVGSQLLSLRHYGRYVIEIFNVTVLTYLSAPKLVPKGAPF